MLPIAAPRAKPESACDRLRARLFIETDLDRLVALFAATIADEGFSGHQVADPAPNGGLTALFGDSPALIFGSRARSIAAGSAAMPDRVMLLAGGGAQAPSPQVRGFATLYAARGSTLLELRRDVATLVPLTLTQRIIFARMLAGEAAIDIATALGLSTTAVLAHVDQAIATLRAGSSADAIAEAARKGWLVAIPDTFPLSGAPKNKLTSIKAARGSGGGFGSCFIL